MADALMNWDKLQNRWRKEYKGKKLQVKASDLGGTNFTDTLKTANQWFLKMKGQIDSELVLRTLGTLRPNEQEYSLELESIQSTLKVIPCIISSNPDLESVLVYLKGILQQRKTAIKKALEQPELPSLTDSLRNPLYIPSSEVLCDALSEVVQTALQTFDDNRRADKYNNELQEWDYEQITKEILDSQKGGGQKQELNISEYDRGRIVQLVKEHNVIVPESKQLDFHIDRFIAAQQRRHKEGKISAGRLGKIINVTKRYREWTSITRIDKIGTKEHIEAYHRSLSDEVIEKKIKPGYAKDLFTDFKTLINWLFMEQVLSTYPDCLKLKGKEYRFQVERQKPKTIDLERVREILKAANPHLKLHLLLTLNCGFYTSDIGNLLKDEYDAKTGKITRKRSKTQKYDSVPTVCYKLWPETKELLDREIDDRKKYPQCPESANCLLVNRNGNLLWKEYVNDAEKPCKSDSICNSFKRLIGKLRKNDSGFPAISYKLFRKTVATLIGNKPEFRSLDWMWLGHAPKTIAGQHYVASADTVLDECIAWIHDQIFSSKSPFGAIDNTLDSV